MVFANIYFSRVKCHFRMLKRDFTKLKKDLAEIEETTLSKKVKRATNKKAMLCRKKNIVFFIAKHCFLLNVTEVSKMRKCLQAFTIPHQLF